MKRSVICLVALLAVATLGSMSVVAQTIILDNAKVVDKSTGKQVRLSKPASLSSDQSINFPSTPGTQGQVMAISSVAGSTLNLGWTTASVSTATLSKRVASALTSAPSQNPPDGLSVSVGANKKYRVAGIIRCGRVDDNASKSEGIKFTISGPSGSTYVAISVMCYDCPVVTGDGVPTHKNDASATATTATINPDAATDSYAMFAYGVEGVVHVGSSDGTLKISVDDDGSGSNSVKIESESFIVLTEVN